ncbi:hypothetical protein LXT21_43700 [Myxococcus sp. K38C18041901]|nr:hypothetical protein [Myxococcus guangdongensis]
MRPQQPSPERRVDRDGVTHVAASRPSSGGGVAKWLVGGALVFTVLSIAVSLWWSASAVEVEAPPPFVEAPAPVAEPAPMVARAPVPRAATRAAPQAPVAMAAPIEEAPPPAPEPDMPSEQPTGLQLYKRGTKPLKRGIVVPEDFELPPGYVRHYQSTDEGERVEAILMFHPDHKPVDANGQPIPMPENRVVPEELAPPGMPLRMLELPKSDESKDAP